MLVVARLDYGICGRFSTFLAKRGWVIPLSQYHAARQEDPGKFDNCRNKAITDGVTAIVCEPKGGGAWVIQSLRFDRAKFSADEARAWLKKHGFSVAQFEPAAG